MKLIIEIDMGDVSDTSDEVVDCVIRSALGDVISGYHWLLGKHFSKVEIDGDRPIVVRSAEAES